jgi:hypothetical protein
MQNEAQLKSLLAGLLAIRLGPRQGNLPHGRHYTAVGVALSALRINPDGTTGPAVGPNPIGICECIRLRMSISYLPIGPSGGKTAFFEGGTMTVQTLSGSFVDVVTPAAGVPLIGEPTDPQGQACGPKASISRCPKSRRTTARNPDMDASGNITFWLPTSETSVSELASPTSPRAPLPFKCTWIGGQVAPLHRRVRRFAPGLRRVLRLVPRGRLLHLTSLGLGRAASRPRVPRLRSTMRRRPTPARTLRG